MMQNIVVGVVRESMNIHEQVRAKNVDLLVESYNREVGQLNSDGFINPASNEVKGLKNRYENLMARFDTDKNCKHNKKGYKYNIYLDSKAIIGVKGLKPNIKVEGK